MTDKEKEAIEKLKETAKQCHNSKECWDNESCCDCYVEVEDILAIETVLNLIKKQQEEIGEYEKTLDIFDEREYRKRYLEEERAKRKDLLYPDADEIYKRYYEQKAELEKKDKIIANSINEIEKLREYFSEDLQPDFIRILEILKDKKVIEW